MTFLFPLNRTELIDIINNTPSDFDLTKFILQIPQIWLPLVAIIFITLIIALIFLVFIDVKIAGRSRPLISIVKLDIALLMILLFFIGLLILFFFYPIWLNLSLGGN